MFQAPPPPPPEPPQVVRTDSSYLSIARRDVPLTLVKGKQSEKALIRYQLLVRTDMEATQPPLAAEAALAEITCAWTITTWLQREPCFESLTGRLACGETYTTRLEDRERGSEKTLEEASACNVVRPTVTAAQTRLGAVVAATAQARFDDDLARRLTPELAKVGLTMTPRVK